MKRLIRRDRSVIVSCDVPDIITLGRLVHNTADVEGVGGYKVGLELALRFTLGRVVSVIRARSDKPIIHDNQKAATDTPKIGERFARVCAGAGVNAVILFPFGGSVTEVAWIKACQDKGLTVIVGGHMTQPGFFVSEGGFIGDGVPAMIYLLAAQNGVRDFVVPGNKPEYVAKYQSLLERALGEGNFDLYAPGFIAQGGDIAEVSGIVHGRWHAIVGQAIYESVDPRSAAIEAVAQLDTPVWAKLALALWKCGAVKFDFEDGFRLKDGSLSPIYIDLRRIRSYPEVMDLIAEALAGVVSGLGFDYLADVPTSATPMVAVLANRLRVPQITPRMDEKAHGLRVPINGVFEVGKTAILADDVVTQAGSKLEAVEILRRHGLNVSDVVVVVDRQQGGAEELAKIGCRLRSVLQLKPMLKFYARSGLITTDELRRVLEYLDSGK